MAEEKQLKARFQNKTDTLEKWTEAGEKGFVPKKGEIIVYQEKDSKNSKIKIGNGSTAIHELPFTEGEGTGDDNNVGKITEEGGEIFNDYDHNTADLHGHAEGDFTSAGWRSHSEGYLTNAKASTSHAEGRLTQAIGKCAHAEGIEFNTDFSDYQGKIYLQETVSIENDIITVAPVPRGLETNNAIYLTNGTNSTQITPTDAKIIKEVIIHGLEYETYIITDLPDAGEEGPSGPIPGVNLQPGYLETTSEIPVTYIDNDKYILAADAISFANDPTQTKYGIKNFNQTEIAGGANSISFYGDYTPSVGEEFTAYTNVTATLTLHSPFKANNYTEEQAPNGEIPAGALVRQAMRTTASGEGAHAEGMGTTASGYVAHVEGNQSRAIGWTSHAEGWKTVANGDATHAEGSGTYAVGHSAHAEGRDTQAKGSRSHAEGSGTLSSGLASHAEGYETKAVLDYSHAEGQNTTSSGVASHSEGHKTQALKDYSHAEGNETRADGDGSHAEGTFSKASGSAAHAEGNGTHAFSNATHTEGFNTKAGHFIYNSSNDSYENGNDKSVATTAHAEGHTTTAIATGAHAEGRNTLASASAAHAEGQSTTASGEASHAEGLHTVASGKYSHASGFHTIASGQAQMVIGKYNNTWDDALFIIGNGQDSENRNNILEVGNHGMYLQDSTHEANITITPQQIYINVGGIPNTTTLDSDGLFLWNPNGQTVNIGYDGISYTGNEGHILGTISMNQGIFSRLDFGDPNYDGPIEEEYGYLYIDKTGVHIPQYDSTALTRFDKNGLTLLNDDAVSTIVTANGINTVDGTLQTTIGPQGIKVVSEGPEGEVSAWTGTFTDVNTYNLTINGKETAGVKVEGGGEIFNSYIGNEANKASGQYSHAEGYKTQVFGKGGHSEGTITIANGSASHAEGNSTQAFSDAAHAEGYKTKAGNFILDSSGNYITGGSTSTSSTAHAEGHTTVACGTGSHAEGRSTVASGNAAHAEGNGTKASGAYAHAEGNGTKASGEAQHVQGRFNIEDTSKRYAHIVGNGSSTAPSNAHTLDWNGNAWFAGDIRVGGTHDQDALTKRILFNDDGTVTWEYVQ